MAETLMSQGSELSPEATQQMGRVTILEALAQETETYSPDMSHRSTMQGSTDFEDD